MVAWPAPPDKDSRPLVVANWKMHGTPATLESWLAPIRQSGREASAARVECVACPPFPLLAQAAAALGAPSENLSIGAQDCHARESGAFTGAVSATLLASLKCRYVILGHSERRRDFLETPESIRAKAEAACAAGLTPILCLGEDKTLRARDEGGAGPVARHLADELTALWPDSTPETIAPVVAYEPVWAIGSGRAATPQRTAPVFAALRKRLSEIAPPRRQRTRFLYGGSVGPENAASFLAQTKDKTEQNNARADGLLVGGASIRPEEFAAIIKAVQRAAASP